jgi:hypothetical protein
MSKEERSKELEEFMPLEKFEGNLKMDFMGMKVKVKYVGTPAINKAQTIGKIGMAPEQGEKSVIFYSRDESNVEIITTQSGDKEGEASTDKLIFASLSSSATPIDLYQKHLSLIQGKTLKKLDKFQKQAKKIPEDMMKIFMKEMNEIGDLFSKLTDNK